jgi:hypothetical protein
MDEDNHRTSPLNMRIQGVTDLSGYRQLTANYVTKDYAMSQIDIEIAYDLPEQEVQGQEPTIETVYVTDYRVITVGAAALVGMGAIGLVLLTVRKKEGK